MALRVLNVDLRVGEQLRIGSAVVVLELKSGRRARLRVQADETVPIAPPGHAIGAGKKLAAEVK